MTSIHRGSVNSMKLPVRHRYETLLFLNLRFLLRFATKQSSGVDHTKRSPVRHSSHSNFEDFFPLHVASMSRGVAGTVWEGLKINGNFCDMTRHEIDENAS